MTDISRRKFAAAAVAGLGVAATAPAIAQRRYPPMAGAGGLTAGDWMNQVRAQHAAIDRQFQVLKRPLGLGARRAGLMTLKTMLTAHSIAEETALYPGVVLMVDRGEGDRLYREQQEAKVMLAEIDNMMAMGRTGDFLGRLTALETAIKAHVAEEENDAYPRLMRAANPMMNAKMTADFRMSFNRYYNG